MRQCCGWDHDQTKQEEVKKDGHGDRAFRRIRWRAKESSHCWSFSRFEADGGVSNRRNNMSYKRSRGSPAPGRQVAEIRILCKASREGETPVLILKENLRLCSTRSEHGN